MLSYPQDEFKSIGVFWNLCFVHFEISLNYAFIIASGDKYLEGILIGFLMILKKWIQVRRNFFSLT